MATIRSSEPFKREAVRLVTEGGSSHKAAADAVGVCSTTITSWVARYRDESPRRTTFASDQNELEHLRKEKLQANKALKTLGARERAAPAVARRPVVGFGYRIEVSVGV